MLLPKSYDTLLNEENLQHLASKPAVSERQAVTCRQGWPLNCLPNNGRMANTPKRGPIPSHGRSEDN